MDVGSPTSHREGISGRDSINSRSAGSTAMKWDAKDVRRFAIRPAATGADPVGEQG